MEYVPGTGMSRIRVIIAHVVIAGVIGGSFYDIVTRQEHWPFSNYPMFSSVHRSWVLRWPRLYGVTAEGTEVPLLSHRELWPLDQSRLPLGLRAMSSEPDADERVRSALLDVLRRYEGRRTSEEHSGRPLVAIRLYLVSWQLEPFARNLDSPTERRLLADATLAAR
jgi:hypothetical protein